MDKNSEMHEYFEYKFQIAYSVKLSETLFMEIGDCPSPPIIAIFIWKMSKWRQRI